MPTYLLTNQVIATELWAALETNPSYSQDLTTKATVAKNIAGTYFKYRPGVTVSATGDFPDIELNPKSGWRIGTTILNGSFAAGNWTFKVALYNNTKYGHAVKIAARLSRSVNADGSSATLIGAVTESPNTITLADAAGDIQTDSWTYNPGVVTLTNEYLFVEYRCVIVTAATNNSAQHDFICDENPATRLEEIITTTFTPSGGVVAKKYIIWGGRRGAKARNREAFKREMQLKTV
jgi:hypothetical protein